MGKGVGGKKEKASAAQVGIPKRVREVRNVWGRETEGRREF